MNKDLIHKRFAKNLCTYRENARIQKQMAERLFSFLPRTEFENILEIGCGTGFLTEIVSKKLSYKSYIANDIVEECEDFVKEIDENITFFGGDIEDLLKLNAKTYDLIISNAVLQWIENPISFIDVLYNRLNAGGILLFSIFGVENFREIYHVLGKTLSYYSLKEWEEKLAKYSSVIEEEIRVLAFKTPKDILRHLQLTGVNALEEAKWTKTDFKKFENGYNNFCSNIPTLTYHPIYILINKCK